MGTAQALMLAGSPVMLADVDGITPLHAAVLSGSRDCIRLLILSCADVNVTDISGRTPIIVAAQTGRVECASLLLEFSANTKKADAKGRTALHYVAKGGHLGMIEALMIELADFYAQDKEGRTPLHYAALNGHCFFLQEVIERFPDLHLMQVVDSKRRTILHAAASNNQVPFMTKLLEIYKNRENFDIDMRAAKKYTPLHLACKFGASHAVNFLLQNGADCSLADSDGMTALHWACGRSCFNAISYLLYEGAHMEAEDDLSRRPLHLAVLSDSPESVVLDCVSMLLKEDCDVNCMDYLGQTPFHYAAGYKRSVELIQLLAQNGAEINQRDCLGRTALHLAFAQGFIPIAEHLIVELEAEPRTKDKYGQTALHTVVSLGHIEATEILIDNEDLTDLNETDISNRTALHCAAFYGKYECTRLLLEAPQMIVDLQDNEGCTPFFLACYQGYLEVARLLAPYSRIDCYDNDGRTALLVAAERNHLEIVDLLLELGANTQVCDHSGNTCLHRAAKNKNAVDVIQRLLVKKAAINAVNAKGYTPLMVAASLGHYRVCKVFINNGANLLQRDTTGLTAEALCKNQTKKRFVKCLHLLQKTIDPSKPRSRRQSIDAKSKPLLRIDTPFPSFDTIDKISDKVSSKSETIAAAGGRKLDFSAEDSVPEQAVPVETLQKIQNDEPSPAVPNGKAEIQEDISETTPAETKTPQLNGQKEEEERVVEVSKPEEPLSEVNAVVDDVVNEVVSDVVNEIVSEVEKNATQPQEEPLNVVPNGQPETVSEEKPKIDSEEAEKVIAAAEALAAKLSLLRKEEEPPVEATKPPQETPVQKSPAVPAETPQPSATAEAKPVAKPAAVSKPSSTRTSIVNTKEIEKEMRNSLSSQKWLVSTKDMRIGLDEIIVEIDVDVMSKLFSGGGGGGEDIDINIEIELL
eukprot:TRINITY_DN2515_c0_g1_i1.p1 TRINITY_DN2515_c0_g1~~TRINITY_DN2515_c0_g1_i1.p1  ORF type:complete len:1052 (-),score=252.73 TRINITY_DN2515_c0_g1_i1:98-2863(-)